MKRAKGFALLAALTLGLAPGVGAAGPDTAAQDVAMGGSFFTRFERRVGYGGGAGDYASYNSDFVRYRARISLDTGPMDIGSPWKLNARFVPQAGGIWSTGGDSLDDASLGVHEAFVRLKKGASRFEIGRFELVYGDHLVLGNVGWHHLGRSFDGVRGHIQPDPKGIWTDVFLTSVNEGPMNDVVSNDAFAGDTMLTGVYTGLGSILGEKAALDFYLLGVLRPKYTTAEEVSYQGAGEFTLGSRIKQKAGPMDWRAEAGVQLGSRRVDTEAVDVFAFQIDAEAGLNLEIAQGLRIGAEGFFASGDDPDTADKLENWNQLYPTAHKWMGFMDYIGGRSNISGGIGHIKLTFLDRMVWMTDVHAFVRPRSPADGQPEYMGIEVDNGLAYLLGKGVKARLAYDIFVQSSDTGGDTLNFTEVEFSTKF